MQGLWSKLDIEVYLFLQDFLGRSAAFDFFISAAVINTLLKCVFVGGCFVAAWCTAQGADQYRMRKALVLTIAAGAVGLALAQFISSNVLTPRPIVFTAPIYLSDGAEFHASQQLEIRKPLDEKGAERYELFTSGGFIENDLKAFPSDHATLYVSMGVGLLMIHRLLGILALSWTFLMILVPRMMIGFHWFTDVVAGSIIGAGLAYLFVSTLTDRHIWGVERVLQWSLRQQALSSALMFAIIFDACSQYDNLRLVLKYVVLVVQHILGI